MTTAAKTAAEALIPQFQFERLLNQDQNGRRISLLGTIASDPALLILERAAFPTDPEMVSSLLKSISNTTNLGANDVYHWYLASQKEQQQQQQQEQKQKTIPSAELPPSPLPPPSLKFNLIYPCTATHVKKYSSQRIRMVTETPEIYRAHVQPYMAQKRAEGRLNWVYNIIEGRTEQEDVILRDHGGTGPDGQGFLLLPDLNWDRKTMTSLHLLAIVERRDIWSLRDLTKRHVPWLKTMREKVLKAAVGVYGDRGVEEDELKLYLHYQPTYYHFHIHIVHAMLEAGTTQSTGKAFGFDNIISQLETLSTHPNSPISPSSSSSSSSPPSSNNNLNHNNIAFYSNDAAGMADISLTYFLGEASELWTGVFENLKREEKEKEKEKEKEGEWKR